MNILVTGASGFVGTNFLNYIAYANFNITKLSRSQLQTVSNVKTCDAIVHLAGKAHDLKKISNPPEYYDVNFQLTKRLYDSFLKSEASKFIFVSSVKAVADTVDGALTEDNLPNPQTHYGKSKLMAEEYIQSQPLPAGKTYYILRPCMIHGPGNKGNLNLLYQLVKNGIPYPLAAYHNRRSFLSIDNLCFIIKEILFRDDIPGGVYNLADDDALSTNQVITILSKSLNKKSKLWKMPTGIIKFIAKVGDLLHLPLTTERLNKLTESYVVSNSKIKAAVNKPLPITIQNGLNLTASSFSNNG